MSLKAPRFAVLLGLAALADLVAPPAAEAAACAVPSASYPTVQAAVNDPACNPVTLAATTFNESVTISRGVTVQGASSAVTILRGQVRATAGTSVLTGLHIDSRQGTADPFPEALRVENGARVSGSDLVVTRRPVIFSDDFEIATTGAWSSEAP